MYRLNLGKKSGRRGCETERKREKERDGRRELGGRERDSIVSVCD